MTSTPTQNKGLLEPAINDTGWGNTLNSNFTKLDTILGGYTLLNPTGLTGSAATVNLTVDQCSPQTLIIGASISSAAVLSDNITYVIPSGVGGTWTVYNNTIGSYLVKFACVGANFIVLPQGATTTIISDGTNVGFADSAQNLFNTQTGQLLYSFGNGSASHPTAIAGTVGATGSGSLAFDINTGALRFYGATSGFSGFRAADVTTSVLYTLPPTRGTTGKLLTVMDGSGTLDWTSPAGITLPAAGIAVSTGTAWGTSLTPPAGSLVGTTATQTLTNKSLATVASTATGAAFTLTPGVAPTAPANGDIWGTTAGLFARVNGVTTALLSAAASNLASNGYVKLSNGLILQWGRVTVPQDGSTTVTYTTGGPGFTSFVQPIATAISFGGSTDSQNCGISAYNGTTSFTISNADNPDATVSWFAVGV